MFSQLVFATLTADQHHRGYSALQLTAAALLTNLQEGSLIAHCARLNSIDGSSFLLVRQDTNTAFLQEKSEVDVAMDIIFETQHTVSAL